MDRARRAVSRRRLRGRLLVVVVVAVALSGCSKYNVGFYPRHVAQDGLENWQQHVAELNRVPRFFTQYGANDSVAGFGSNARGQFRDDRLGQWRAAGTNPPFNLVYTLPLAFGPAYSSAPAAVTPLIEEQWDALAGDTTVRSSHPTAAGLDRQLYRDFAQRLIDNKFDKPGEAIIRLASEHDCTCASYYSAANYAKFKQAWRAVVTEMRTVFPSLQFDMTNIRTNIGTGPQIGPRVANAYPGDAYVDFVGIVTFDYGDVPSAIGVPSGQRCGWANPQAVWNTLHRPYLDTLKTFVVAHGKRLSVPEWALSGAGFLFVGRCGGDNPNFVQNMHDYVAALGNATAGYYSYFDANPKAAEFELDLFPKAKARFIQLHDAT